MKHIVFIFFINITYAQQFPSDLWHPGLLVTNQGDSIKGNLKYDFENSFNKAAFQEDSSLTFIKKKLVLCFPKVRKCDEKDLRKKHN